MAIFEEKKYLNRDGVKVLWREVAKEISAEATAREAAIAAEAEARAAADAAEAKTRTEADAALAQSIAGLDTKIGTLPTDSANVIAYINKKTEGIATDTALAELQEAVDAIEEDYLKSSHKEALEQAIADEAARADAAEKANAQAIIDEAARADAAEKQVLADAKGYADSIKADLLGEGAISETYDTLKEIADWIAGDGVDATELSSAIAAEAKLREEADNALSDRIKAYEDAKETYATVGALNEVRELADAAQTAQEVSDAIDGKIAALDLANTYESK
jgi:SWI/SNF-related matrix-associated actin-dependent regulator 1 of chromatin subfamily A